MPFEDVGTSRRLSMSQGRILRIWESAKGICVLCDRAIDGTKDRWFVEHIRALELGGKDVDGNCGPAHYTCKPAKDAADHARAAEARHEKAAALGIPQRSTLKGAGFKKAAPKKRASTPINKWVGPSLQRSR